MLLLDTNAITDAVRDVDGPVMAGIRNWRDGKVVTNIIVVCEVYFGIEKNGAFRLRPAIERFLDAIDVLNIDKAVVPFYSKARLHVERNGLTIGPNDLLIGSQALAMGATVLTANTREFSRIPDLKIENWRVD
ncbi:MAG: PIN domain-containing protein [Ahrensia sp.]|nr:PIN domain-containing protein [Ahrensia sp.]